MSFHQIAELLWAMVFIMWALLYLPAATTLGVLVLYAVVEFPSDLHLWLLLGGWGLAAAAGGWVMVVLMKRAFEEKSGDGGEFNAQS